MRLWMEPERFAHQLWHLVWTATQIGGGSWRGILPGVRHIGGAPFPCSTGAGYIFSERSSLGRDVGRGDSLGTQRGGDDA